LVRIAAEDLAEPLLAVREDPNQVGPDEQLVHCVAPRHVVIDAILDNRAIALGPEEVRVPPVAIGAAPLLVAKS
jgi:hypothetical protein